MGDTCETKSRGHNPRPTVHLQSHREPGLQGQALSPEPWLATFAEASSSTMPLSHEQDGNKVYIGTQGHERHSGPVPPQQGVGCWSRVRASMSQSHVWLYLSPYRSPAFSLGTITIQEVKGLQTYSSRAVSILPMESSTPTQHLFTWMAPGPVLMALSSAH